jgi:hypothetical protein
LLEAIRSGKLKIYKHMDIETEEDDEVDDNIHYVEA